MNKTYINISGTKVLQYYSSDTVRLNLHFILTTNKLLTKGMPYLLMEGSRSISVRLLDVYNEYGMVYIEIQELESSKTHCLTWNMNYEGSYILWSLADLKTIINMTTK